MARYRKKPIIIDAIQINDNPYEIHMFTEGKATIYPVVDKYNIENFIGEKDIYAVIVPTLEGTMRATNGDYIIKGIQGEFYPCKKDIFEETYEEVIDE